MEEDEHHDSEHEEFIFREFQLWNTVPSVAILLVVSIGGNLANFFFLYALKTKKLGTFSSINPILVCVALKNLLVTIVCSPLCIAMLLRPDWITMDVCFVQEHLTFFALYCGLLFPLILSFSRYDKIVRPQKVLMRRWVMKTCLGFTAVISLLMSFQGIILLDPHSCHMWTVIVDNVILVDIYVVASLTGLSICALVSSYLGIYRYTRNHVQQSIARPASRLPNESKINMSAIVTTRVDGQISPNQSSVSVIKGRQTKILLMLFCVVGVLVLCWLPWLCVNSLITTLHVLPEARILTMSIVYIPSFTDPLIYLLFSTKGRNAIKDTFIQSNV